MDFKRCSLVKGGRQSYFVALSDMVAMSSYLESKELGGKRIAP